MTEKRDNTQGHGDPECGATGAGQPSATTDDIFLGGRLLIRQPRKGYRAGADAVLLAAAVPDAWAGDGPVLDVGSGVGTVGLCLARRVTQARITLLERQEHLVVLARHNISHNGFADRVTAVEADILRPSAALAAAGLADDSFALAVANPPYHDSASGTMSGNAVRAQSHQMPDDDLEVWARFITRMVRPSGRMLLIHKADALPRILAAFDGRFGELAIRPIHARDGEAAIRVLVSGIKGSRAPVVLLPPVYLHGDGQAFRPNIDAVFRQGAALA